MYSVRGRRGSIFGDGPSVCEFLCDTSDDISTLPTSSTEGTGGKTEYDNQKCSAGSIAFISGQSDIKFYTLNNQDIWDPQ